jgi:hypothetical protein
MDLINTVDITNQNYKKVCELSYDNGISLNAFIIVEKTFKK